MTNSKIIFMKWKSELPRFLNSKRYCPWGNVLSRSTTCVSHYVNGPNTNENIL